MSERSKARTRLVGEEARNLSVSNTLRQALNNSGLAHTRLADQHRVVLRPAAEDLDHSLQLAITADERVELRIHRGLRQVAAELGQQARFALPLLLLRRLLLRHSRQLLANRGKLQAALLQDLGGKALFLAQQAKQQMLRPNMLVSQTLGLFSGVGENALALVGERQVDRCGDLFADGGVSFDLLADRFHGCMRAKETVGERLIFAQEAE